MRAGYRQGAASQTQSPRSEQLFVALEVDQLGGGEIDWVS